MGSFSLHVNKTDENVQLSVSYYFVKFKLIFLQLS